MTQSGKMKFLRFNAEKVFPKPYFKIVVTAGGKIEALDKETKRIPIFNLGEYLIENYWFTV